MSVAVVQSINSDTVGGFTCSAVFTGNTTTGNTIVAIGFGFASTAISVTGVAVNAGSATFAKLIAKTTPFTDGSLEAWIAPNITGGTTPQVTVTWNLDVQDDPNTASVMIYELSSMPTTTTTDGTAAGNNGTGSGTTLTSPSITTTGSNDIIFSAFFPGNQVTVAESGWTGLLDAANTFGCTQYKVFTSPQTSLTSTVTDAGSSDTFASIIFGLLGTSSAIPPSVSANPLIIYP